jgi:3'(2'), 5'-bisphosphate nucleotidase
VCLHLALSVVKLLSPPVSEQLEERFLALAAAAVDAVGIAIVGLRDALPVGIGADGAPTEAADRAAERAAIAILRALSVPIVSEESGLIGADTLREDAAWIVLDPLDGSRNYCAGYPPYATAIGLVRDGRPLAGFVGEHSTGRRWWARRGGGAFADGHPIAPRRSPLVAVPSPHARSAVHVPLGAHRVRISGSTTVDLVRVAERSLAFFSGFERAVVHVHDLAGPLAILDEAGACTGDAEGDRPTLIPDVRAVYRVAAAADAQLLADLVQDHRTLAHG